MFLFRNDHAEVHVPRPRIWLFASSVLQQLKEGNALKNLLLTRVIKMTWKWEFELHPKILLQYSRFNVISLSTVYNGKCKRQISYLWIISVTSVVGKMKQQTGNACARTQKQSHMKSLLPYHVTVRAPLMHFERSQSFHKKTVCTGSTRIQRTRPLHLIILKTKSDLLYIKKQSAPYLPPRL
jgi:hypothetical protein